MGARIRNLILLSMFLIALSSFVSASVSTTDLKEFFTMNQTTGDYSDTVMVGVGLVQQAGDYGQEYSYSGGNDGLYNNSDWFALESGENRTYAMHLKFTDVTTQKGVFWMKGCKSTVARSFFVYQDVLAGEIYISITSSNETEKIIQIAAAHRINDWMHLVVREDNTANNLSFFVDGVFNKSYAWGDSLPNYACVATNQADKSFSIGAVKNEGGNAAGMIGEIDNVGIWTRVLSDAEISELAAGAIPEAAAAAHYSDIDLIFTATGDVANDTNNFLEGENFCIHVNYTNATGGLINDSVATCTIKTINTTGERDYPISDNFTICDTGCDNASLNYEFNMSTTVNVTKDFIHFSACHKNLETQDLTATFQCGANSTDYVIAKSQIPSCSEGALPFFIESTSCIGSVFVNLTLENDAPAISKAHEIIDLSYDRQFGVWNYNTSYNSTYDTYRIVRGCRVEYYEHGEKPFTATCVHEDDSNLNNATTENVIIENVAPIIIFDSVGIADTFSDLLNGGVYEYTAGLMDFRVIFSDNDIYNGFVNISNSTGHTLLYSTSINGSHIINGTLFRDDDNNPIKIDAWANDSYNESTSDTIYINVTDTTNPACSGVSSTTVPVNSTYTHNITCTDESLYLFNISCSNSFNFSETGLNVLSYSFLNSSVITDTTTCLIEVCDAHTGNPEDFLSRDWSIIESDDRIKFTMDDESTTLSSLDNDTMTYEIGEDRISFTIDFKDKTTDTHKLYYIAGKDSYYFPSTVYKGHIVDTNSRTWFDLNSEFPENNVQVSQYRGDCALIPGTTCEDDERIFEIDITSALQVIEFHSIGPLNCRTYTQTISLESLRDLSFFRPFESVQEALTIMFFWGFWLMLVVLTLVLKGSNDETIQLLNLFQVFFGIIGGIMTFTISPALALLISFVAVGVFWGKIYNP